MAQPAYTPHRFTIDEVRSMVAAGVLSDPDRYELIDGELVAMPADGPLHQDYSSVIGRWLYANLGDGYMVMPDTNVNLSPYDAPAPDWWVFPASVDTAAVTGRDVLLAIEIADTSLERDLGLKAKLYAAHGVREYWVIAIEKRQIYVHRDPAADGYGFIQRLSADVAAEPGTLPGLSLRLDDLPRVGPGSS